MAVNAASEVKVTVKNNSNSESYAAKIKGNVVIQNYYDKQNPNAEPTGENTYRAEFANGKKSIKIKYPEQNAREEGSFGLNNTAHTIFQALCKADGKEELTIDDLKYAKSKLEANFAKFGVKVRQDLDKGVVTILYNNSGSQKMMRVDFETEEEKAAKEKKIKDTGIGKNISFNA